MTVTKMRHRHFVFISYYPYLYVCFCLGYRNFKNITPIPKIRKKWIDSSKERGKMIHYFWVMGKTENFFVVVEGQLRKSLELRTVNQQKEINNLPLQLVIVIINFPASSKNPLCIISNYCYLLRVLSIFIILYNSIFFFLKINVSLYFNNVNAIMYVLQILFF